jgi:MoaA/NifB/PqqE/SkfB family radical SAM enzyme
MILRAKNFTLFESELTENQRKNSELNLKETYSGYSILSSYPRRIVAELTNSCNINCIMCGREQLDFTPSFFELSWFKILEEAFVYTEEIVLHGWGEPTVHPSFEQILEYLNRFSLRKYFCTNGTTLGNIKEMLFKHHVDIVAISLDGPDAATNDSIRRGARIDEITKSLKEIIEYKKKNKLDYPYINFVFTAMKRNIDQLPNMVALAAECGVEEVKVVYLTSFSKDLNNEVLFDEREKVRKIFDIASELSNREGISLKLPYISGEDPAGEMPHRECFFPYRDLFIGSNGFVRPCVSTGEELFCIEKQKTFMEIWNHEKLGVYRRVVNSTEDMKEGCRKCYHSSCANWNKDISFVQTGEMFSPKWKVKL